MTTNDDRSKQLEVYLDSIPDAVVAIDKQFKILFFNKSAEKLTGHTIVESIGEKLDRVINIVHEKNRSLKILSAARVILSSDSKLSDKEVLLIAKDGAELPIGHSFAATFDDKGLISGAILIFRDIRHEREIDKMKNEFVSLASHELRTPMTSIAGFVDMIREGRYGHIAKNVEEPLTYIAESTDRLIKLVDDLLNVSRIEIGKMKFLLTKVDVSAVTAKVIAELQPIARQKKLDLVVKIPEKTWVFADNNKVEQILSNLIGNAIKFSDKGEIAVSTYRKNDTEVVEIKDTGVGIPKSEQPKLFGKFQQVNIGLAGLQSGTGLGLYLSRQMARGMSGDVMLVRSEPNVGSVFAIKLSTKPVT